MKLRKGDIVSVNGAIVADQGKGQEAVYVNIHGNNCALGVSYLSMVRPYFEKGDYAYLPDPTLQKVQVLGVHGNYVWIEEESGDNNVVFATDLVRDLTEDALT